MMRPRRLLDDPVLQPPACAFHLSTAPHACNSHTHTSRHAARDLCQSSARGPRRRARANEAHIRGALDFRLFLGPWTLQACCTSLAPPSRRQEACGL
eukprot:10202224-Alexandrium_andersonii.AAC.1